ncbi:TPA: hypothetical protein N0F65_010282 [Lagenidium giganteum]|uniref:ABC transporter domain-containing protein n=1 Tax=Lagenidium giganteum TaxID=4803 RepID=A0AAV2YLB0_9STRA|nr:TPA: hypothetical protein N0F65_010282 [Lagenidium giganteum]
MTHPERSCSWFSWLFLLFHEELFRQNDPPPAPWRRLFAHHSPRLTSINDVVPLPVEWQCVAAKRALTRALGATNGDVLAAVLRIGRTEVLQASAWSLVGAIFGVVHSFALLELLGTITNSSGNEMSVVRVAALVLCVIVARVADVVARQHQSLSSVHLVVRVMGGLSQLIMERAVRAPWIHLVGEENDAPPSSYIRQLNVEIERVCVASEYSHNKLGAVIKLAFNWLLLERYVGHDAGSLMVIAALVWRTCTCAFARYRWGVFHRLETAHARTVGALNDFFNWAFPIKLYAWENKMLTRILQLRREEEREKKVSQKDAITKEMTTAVNSLTVVFVLAVLSWQRVPLTADRVFAVVLFVNPIHDNIGSLTTMLQRVPHDKTLDRFIASTEQPPSQQNAAMQPICQSKQERIAVGNAVVCAAQRLLFVNVSFQINRGELAIVHGPAGAGKSTILRVLLGEVTLSSGSLLVPANWRVAYCAQEHWLQTGTIRQNILLGSIFDKAKYQRVLDACGLLDDLDRLMDGDATSIGPRGVKLSGGQKARVALARACYADADLYLLDCTLDSVDPLVQQEVFDKCVCNLLRLKTIVMVTQNPELASSDWADRRLEIRQASIFETTRRKQGKHGSPVRSARGPTRQLRNQASAEAISHPTDSSIPSNAVMYVIANDGEVYGYPNVREMLQIFSLGNSTFALLGLFVVVLSGMMIACEVWLAFGIVSSDDGNALMVYASVVLSSLATLLVCTWLASIFVGNYASEKFRRLVTEMADTSLRFFSDVQHGELSYRVWGDLFYLERRWLWFFHSAIRNVTSVMSRLAIMVWAGGVGALVLFVVPVADWWYLTNDVTNRDVMQSMSHALVKHENWLLEMSGGLSCIRLLGKEKQDSILQQYSEHMNAVSTMIYIARAHKSYVLVRFALAEAWPLLVLVYVAFVTPSAESSVFGLLLYCAVTLPPSAESLSTSLSNISCDLISIQQIDRLSALAAKYSEKSSMSTVSPPVNWPSSGQVRFEKVTFAYESRVLKPMPVLREVSFVVNGGEKIGLVGRTGSGKTSVAMALFRIHEVSSGRIVVDGVDIRMLAPQELRSRLSIIPQSPVFYRCSVRSYLNPFDDFDDADLWCVLQTVGLAGSGVGLVTSLDDMLADDGVNWSVGERQLLSLARSLLKPSKVLVLDEAFSSLEQERDDAVVRIVGREFDSSTVFLITHRMDQVLEFDRILVMDNGRAVEMGSVEELLSNPESRFYELLESSPLTR